MPRNREALGGISQIDDLTYKFINVPNIRRPVTTTLHSPYSNSEIRYTLNGKNPKPLSHLYAGPLVYWQNASGSEHTAIKARVYDKRNTNNKSKIIRLEFRVIPTG
jgi:Fn3 associated